MKNSNSSVQNILNNYLYDDGFEHSLVGLAKLLDIKILALESENEYLAVLIENKIIVVNSLRVNDRHMQWFMTSYLVADFIRNNNTIPDEYSADDVLNKKNKIKKITNFRIENIDMETYELAQKIYIRCLKYKSDAVLHPKNEDLYKARKI